MMKCLNSVEGLSSQMPESIVSPASRSVNLAPNIVALEPIAEQNKINGKNILTIIDNSEKDALGAQAFLKKLTNVPDYFHKNVKYVYVFTEEGVFATEAFRKDLRDAGVYRIPGLGDYSYEAIANSNGKANIDIENKKLQPKKMTEFVTPQMKEVLATYVGLKIQGMLNSFLTYSFNLSRNNEDRNKPDAQKFIEALNVCKSQIENVKYKSSERLLEEIQMQISGLEKNKDIYAQFKTLWSNSPTANLKFQPKWSDPCAFQLDNWPRAGCGGVVEGAAAVKVQSQPDAGAKQ